MSGRLNRLRNRIAYTAAMRVFATYATDDYAETFARVLEAGQDSLDVALGGSEVMSR